MLRFQQPHQTMRDKANSGSGSVEDTLSQEVQLGSSIHLAFEEFEPGDLALRLPIAIREFQSRAHCCIMLESRREALQVWQPLVRTVSTHVQRAGCPHAHHLGKGLGQGNNLGNRGIMLPYLHDLFLLVRGTLLRATYQEI